MSSAIDPANASTIKMLLAKAKEMQKVLKTQVAEIDHLEQKILECKKNMIDLKKDVMDLSTSTSVLSHAVDRHLFSRSVFVHRSQNKAQKPCKWRR